MTDLFRPLRDLGLGLQHGGKIRQPVRVHHAGRLEDAELASQGRRYGLQGQQLPLREQHDARKASHLLSEQVSCGRISWTVN